MKSDMKSRFTVPKSILLATDLSDLHHLMPFAIQMARETGARLQLLHILPFSEEIKASITGRPYYDPEGAISHAYARLDPWCKHAQQAGIECSSTVREYRLTAPAILEAIRLLRPDRLILGNRTTGKLSQLVLGSVSEPVLRSAEIPVFTIGPEALFPEETTAQQPTVIFATDLSDGYEASAMLAGQLAARMRAILSLVHVLPTKAIHSTSNNILPSTVRYELEVVAKKISGKSGAVVETKVLHGDPAIEILAEAKARDARLIVMGTTNHSMVENLIHDHTICRVVAHARCPVVSLHGAPQLAMEHAEAAVTHTLE